MTAIRSLAERQIFRTLPENRTIGKRPNARNLSDPLGCPLSTHLTTFSPSYRCALSGQAANAPVADVAWQGCSRVSQPAMTDDRATDFASYGAQLFKGALNPCIDVLEAGLSALPQEEAGLRLHGIDGLAPSLAIDGCVGAVAASVLGATARPVRAILFNK